MPKGLDIDHKKQLFGTVPPYTHHVVIRTGRDDWSSRIEDEKDGERVNFAKALKGLVGPGGKYHDVCFSREHKSFLKLDQRPLRGVTLLIHMLNEASQERAHIELFAQAIC